MACVSGENALRSPAQMLNKLENLRRQKSRAYSDAARLFPSSSLLSLTFISPLLVRPCLILHSSANASLPSICNLSLHLFLFFSKQVIQMRHVPRPHPVTSVASIPAQDPSQIKPSAKRRGSYNCGRCGLPKKGHSCQVPKSAAVDGESPLSTPTATPSTDFIYSSAEPPSPSSSSHPFHPPLPPLPPPCRQSNLRRALSFDDTIVLESTDEDVEVEELEEDQIPSGSGMLPMSCLWEVLKKLPPTSVLAAATVCKRWRDTTKKLWRATEELRLRVPAKAQVGFVGSVLQKCPGLVKLSLRMERLGFARIHNDVHPRIPLSDSTFDNLIVQ